jgi:hypothetical protein
MFDASQRIRSLDLSLFDAIPTQTTEADRRALLGVHRTVMNKHGRFAYLEIGSHLGGSIQPYLLNSACLRIYSIDPRPFSQPDDRKKDCAVNYPENSTERMLDNLGELNQEALSKVDCFSMDASEVNVTAITIRPIIAFIDGEHTRSAVNSDVEFCLRVIAQNGVIIFHDFQIVYKAVFDTLRRLRNREILAYLIEGSVFAVFFNPALVHEDEYLRARYMDHRHDHRRYAASRQWGRITPEPIKQIYRSARAAWARGYDG